MHASAFEAMAGCVERHVPPDRHYDVLELGSFLGRDRRSYRELFAGHDCTYLGVDIRPGRNVDVVMRKPYTVPVKGKSVDVVLTGQTFEHIPFFWVSFMELARVLRPDGHLFLIVPSRGHVHSHYDCWRYYPDGMRALAAFGALDLVEAHTDFPPTNGQRHDYTRIDPATYWGDTVGVFRKPARYPRVRTAVVRRAGQMWANRVRDLESHPLPPTA